MPRRAIWRYVVARSGLRKTEPTCGASPPGRKRRRVERNASKRTLFSSVCWRNVGSTTKPWRATRIAGRKVRPSDIVPQRSSARCQVARVPGTPTETPLVTSSGVKL